MNKDSHPKNLWEVGVHFLHDEYNRCHDFGKALKETCRIGLNIGRGRKNEIPLNWTDHEEVEATGIVKNWNNLT